MSSTRMHSSDHASSLDPAAHCGRVPGGTSIRSESRGVDAAVGESIVAPATRPAAMDIHAFRALAALELYEAQLKALLQDRDEPGRRHRLHENMAALRRCCAGCAGLTVPWLDLMISHFELLERLDEGARPCTDADDAAVAQATRRHQACLRELALACRRKMQARTVVGTRESVSRTRRAARAQAEAGGARDAS